MCGGDGVPFKFIAAKGVVGREKKNLVTHEAERVHHSIPSLFIFKR